jgi:heme exporter protein A
MGEILLRVRNLACVRGGRRLFADLDLDVGPGEAVVVSGPNGSGKSSLLRALAGLLPPAAGTIERPGRIAYLGHDNALKTDRTLAAELGWWARIDGGECRLALGLEALAEVPVRMLSAGQKRRAALARVLASRAGLWLLDEPGAGLDAASGALLAAEIGAHRSAGGGVVMASHGETRIDGARELSL